MIELNPAQIQAVSGARWSYITEEDKQTMKIVSGTMFGIFGAFGAGAFASTVPGAFVGQAICLGGFAGFVLGYGLTNLTVKANAWNYFADPQPDVVVVYY